MIDHILNVLIAAVMALIIQLIMPEKIVGKRWGIRKGPSTLDEDKEENDGQVISNNSAHCC